jgi:hypothetical protein
VRRENQRGVIRYFAEFLDENGTLGTQIVDDIAVMDDFMPHVNGRAEQIERPIDDFDGSVDAGTESAGIGQLDFHTVSSLRCPSILNTCMTN